MKPELLRDSSANLDCLKDRRSHGGNFCHSIARFIADPDIKNIQLMSPEDNRAQISGARVPKVGDKIELNCAHVGADRYGTKDASEYGESDTS